MIFSCVCILGLIFPDAIVSERLEENTNSLLLDRLQTKLIPPPVTLAFRNAMAERRKAMKSLDEEKTRHERAVEVSAETAKAKKKAEESAVEKAASLAKHYEEHVKKMRAAGRSDKTADAKSREWDKARTAYEEQQEKLAAAQKQYNLKKIEAQKMIERFDKELQALQNEIGEAKEKSERAATALQETEIEKREAGKLSAKQQREAVASRLKLNKLASECQEARKASDAHALAAEEAQESLKLQLGKLQDAKVEGAKQEGIYKLIKEVWSSISGRKPPGVDMAFGNVFGAAMEHDGEIMDSSTPWSLLMTHAREELKGAVQAYNKFVAASAQIMDTAPDIYAKCVEADKEIRERGLNEIRTLCLGGIPDLPEQAAEEHCGNGLFRQLNVTLDAFPAVSEASPIASPTSETP
eukprot:TRINITY_DN15745_c0_g3_i1.p1 TRINITY_DN15745_c0_g3~~TRINITY_DN15745_c0_g3_i1.p1  ORF type:complete len:411 (-),score=110.63 TRINITY_DN15745_c0_g3_i1:296-1528(-)